MQVRYLNRTILTGLLIITYVACTNIWIYLLSNSMLTNKQNRLSSYSINGLMILLSYFDLRKITGNYYHYKFNEAAFMCIFSNFTLNIANHIGLLGNKPIAMFLTFNGFFFVLTSMILISGGRHGHFENE